MTDLVIKIEANEMNGLAMTIMTAIMTVVTAEVTAKEKVEVNVTITAVIEMEAEAKTEMTGTIVMTGMNRKNKKPLKISKTS